MNMSELNEAQQRKLDVHNCGEAIERAIWGALKPEQPYESPLPFGMCTADVCCRNPLPFMYCAFAFLIGKGSVTAESNLREFDHLYRDHLGRSLDELFDEDDGFTEKLMADFRRLCR